jgi:hypothetical protein
VRALRTKVGNRVSFAAVAAVKPSAGGGHRSGNWVCRNCQHADVTLVGAEKGCRWVAAAERAEAARVAKEMTAAAHAAGGKSLTPKPPSRSGRWSWRLVAVEFNPAVRGSGWPKSVRAAWRRSAGRGPWNCAGEVLEQKLQGAGQDHPFVLGGERVRKVEETLDLVANLMSLARQEVSYE